MRSEAVRGAVVVTVPKKLRRKIGDDESEELVSLINSIVLSNIVTKADLSDVAAKSDLAEVRKEISGLRALMIGLWTGQFLAFCGMFVGLYVLVFQILR